MSGTSARCSQKTLWDPLVTGLPGSADGPTPSTSPDGPQNGRSGPAPAPVRRFPKRPGKARVKDAVRQTLCRILSGQGFSCASGAAANGTRTTATCGLSSGVSSGATALQSFLESRLPEKMGLFGFPAYRLRWKSSDIPWGPPICRLVASVRRTSGRGCSGWRSPGATDHEGGVMEIRPECADHYKLRDQVALAGWSTPAHRDWRHPNAKPYSERGGGRKGEQLPNQACHLVGWPTPKAAKRGPDYAIVKRPGSGGISLETAAALAGWPTPNTMDAVERKAMRPSRAATGRKTGYLSEAVVSYAILGPGASGFCAVMVPRGPLNPAFSRWLMGFPKVWDKSSPGWRAWESWQMFLSTVLQKQNETASGEPAPTATR